MTQTISKEYRLISNHHDIDARVDFRDLPEGTTEEDLHAWCKLASKILDCRVELRVTTTATTIQVYSTFQGAEDWDNNTDE